MMFQCVTMLCWLGLSTKTIWLGLEKDHGLGKNDHFVNVRETWCVLKLLLPLS